MFLTHILVKAGIRKVGWGQFLGQRYVLFPPSEIRFFPHKARHFVTYWEVFHDDLHAFLLHAELDTNVTGCHNPHHRSHRLNLSEQLTLCISSVIFHDSTTRLNSLKFSFILICLAPTTMSGMVTIQHVFAKWMSTQNVICKSSRTLTLRKY